jgi:hypothetical protein
MVGFLPPLVQEAPFAGLITVVLYAASSVGAGALVGLLLGAAGTMLPGFVGSMGARAALGGAALLGAIVELGGARSRLVEWKRQVPPSWRYDYGPLKAAVMYGASLGTGLTTYISYAGFYPVLLWSSCHGPILGACSGGVYGLAQSLPVLLAGAAMLGGRRPPLDARTLSPRALHRAVGVACLALAAGVFFA